MSSREVPRVVYDERRIVYPMRRGSHSFEVEVSNPRQRSSLSSLNDTNEINFVERRRTLPTVVMPAPRDSRELPVHTAHKSQYPQLYSPAALGPQFHQNDYQASHGRYVDSTKVACGLEDDLRGLSLDPDANPNPQTRADELDASQAGLQSWLNVVAASNQAIIRWEDVLFSVGNQDVSSQDQKVIAVDSVYFGREGRFTKKSRRVLAALYIQVYGLPCSCNGCSEHSHSKPFPNCRAIDMFWNSACGNCLWLNYGCNASREREPNPLNAVLFGFDSALKESFRNTILSSISHETDSPLGHQHDLIKWKLDDVTVSRKATFMLNKTSQSIQPSNRAVTCIETTDLILPSGPHDRTLWRDQWRSRVKRKLPEHFDVTDVFLLLDVRTESSRNASKAQSDLMALIASHFFNAGRKDNVNLTLVLAVSDDDSSLSVAEPILSNWERITPGDRTYCIFHPHRSEILLPYSVGRGVLSLLWRLARPASRSDCPARLRDLTPYFYLIHSRTIDEPDDLEDFEDDTEHIEKRLTEYTEKLERLARSQTEDLKLQTEPQMEVLQRSVTENPTPRSQHGNSLIMGGSGSRSEHFGHGISPFVQRPREASSRLKLDDVHPLDLQPSGSRAKRIYHYTGHEANIAKQSQQPSTSDYLGKLQGEMQNLERQLVKVNEQVSEKTHKMNYLEDKLKEERKRIRDIETEASNKEKTIQSLETELGNIRKTLEQKHKEKMASEMSVLQETHQQRVLELEEDHRQDIYGREDTHQQQLDRLTQDHEEELRGRDLDNSEMRSQIREERKHVQDERREMEAFCARLKTQLEIAHDSMGILLQDRQAPVKLKRRASFPYVAE